MIYYPEQDSNIKNKRKVELDFSNYVTKSDVEKVTGVGWNIRLYWKGWFS